MNETVLRAFVRCLPSLLLLALAGCGGGSRSDPARTVEPDEPAAAVEPDEPAAAVEPNNPAEPPAEPAAPPDPTLADLDGDGTAAAADCDDANAAVWRRVDVFADFDADGVGAGFAVATCVGNAASTGASFVSGDCADDDATRSQTMSYVARDGDADGYVMISSGSLCTNGVLPPGFLSAIGNAKIDCDDRNHTLWRVVALYEDKDGDAVGSGRFTATCIGDPVPSGFSILGYDPVDIAGDAQSALVSDFDLDAFVLTVPDSDDEECDQTTTYTFGTVTAVYLDERNPSIVGLEKDTGMQLTVTFDDGMDLVNRYVVNRCVPLFLTMMEKPGRYDLQLRANLTEVPPLTGKSQLKSCRLQLKP